MTPGGSRDLFSSLPAARPSHAVEVSGLQSSSGALPMLGIAVKVGNTNRGRWLSWKAIKIGSSHLMTSVAGWPFQKSDFASHELGRWWRLIS